jgi:hypothetical protein
MSEARSAPTFRRRPGRLRRGHGHRGVQRDDRLRVLRGDLDVTGVYSITLSAGYRGSGDGTAAFGDARVGAAP